MRGEPASDFSGTEGFEVFSGRVQPHAPGLDRRMWYGGASLRSAEWAGQNGMNFLTSSVVKAEEPGPPRLLFAPDLVGTSAQLAERLWSHAAFREIDEVAFALPFTFEHEDYVQVLTDIATRLGRAPGWRAGR